MKNLELNIAAVERETGLSKDVLRVWERRYGFPAPSRDAHGERLYPVAQVERLRLIRRLMDQGYRPGKLVGAKQDELNVLLHQARSSHGADSPGVDIEALEVLLTAIRQHDVFAYQQALQQRLARQGLQRFVHDTIVPIVRMVGEAWEDGRIEIFEEHLFTELTQRLLRNAIADLPVAEQSPRLLLTSVPDEEHSLGLLMVEALVALEGAECIPLGTQMPLGEINRATRACQADIVALSFSSAFPSRRIPGLSKQLRELLPPSVELWLGGGGVTRLGPQPGIHVLTTLDDALLALKEWRKQRATTPGE